MEQIIEQFERYIKNRYPNSTTAKNYRYDVRQFRQLIRKPPRAVTHEDVERFVEEQLDRGLSATTVKRRLVALHEFFEYLAGENQEEEWPNPVNWRRHRVKLGKPLPRDVGEAEIERLFARITHSRDKAMFRLMLDVGLRVGEVAALRTSDLIVVEEGSRARLRVRGKGGKERFVWLMADTLKTVQAWLEERPAVVTEAMFITRRKKGFSARGIQERLKHYGDLAGVEVSPHQLRHTFGRRMAEAEMPVTSLAALMGHEQVTTTQIYIAGAGVEIQADYQAAMERLKAARQGDRLALGDGPARATGEGELPDVWSLAGVEPQNALSSEVVAEEKMDVSRYWEGLPDWLRENLRPYIAYRQRRWRPSQVRNRTRDRVYTLRRVWRWLLKEEQIHSLADLRRVHVERFVEARLNEGISPVTVNAELTDLWAFLHYWEEHGEPICASVFRVKRPKRGDSLPRFLNESAYRRLESTVWQATSRGERDASLDRAWFYLLGEAGLRVSEVCNVRLGEIDLAGQRLIVHQGKYDRDRSVPLSSTLQAALRAYLPVRGEAQSDHLLIYRRRAIKVSLIRRRLNRYGQQAEVKISPHRLRHTLATRLLNVGMPITSIQRLLGHEKVDTTLIYARVHNETVRRDYDRAQARLVFTSLRIGGSLDAPTEVSESQSVTAGVYCA